MKCPNASLTESPNRSAANTPGKERSLDKRNTTRSPNETRANRRFAASAYQRYPTPLQLASPCPQLAGDESQNASARFRMRCQRTAIAITLGAANRIASA